MREFMTNVMFYRQKTQVVICFPEVLLSYTYVPMIFTIKLYAKNNMTNLFSSKNLKYQEVLL